MNAFVHHLVTAFLPAKPLENKEKPRKNNESFTFKESSAKPSTCTMDTMDTITW